MFSICAALVASFPSQESGELEALIARLAPPPLEEVLAGLPSARPLEEILGTPETEAQRRADRAREDVDRALEEIAWLRAEGTYDRALDRASDLRKEIAAALGDEDPLVRTAAIQVELLELIVGASEELRARFRRSDELTKETFSLYVQGRWPEARAAAIEQLDLSLDLLGRSSDEVATGAYNVALLCLRDRDLESSERLAAVALDVRRELYGEEHPAVTDALHQWASSLSDLGRFREAEACLRVSLERSVARYGPLSATALATANSLAALYYATGDHAPARMVYEHILRGADNLDPANLATALDNLGGILFYGFGDLDAAERHQRRALELRREIFGGRDHNDLAVGLANLADIVAARGELGEAESLCRDALAMKQRIWGPNHSEAALEYGRLADLLMERGDLRGAEVQRRRAVGILQEQGPPEQLAFQLLELGILMQRAGRPDEARGHVKDSLALYTGIYGERHGLVAECQGALAAVALDQGLLEEARRLSVAALSTQRESLGPDHWRLAADEERLGVIEFRTGQLDEARLHFEEALRIVHATYGPGGTRAPRLEENLGMIAWAQGHGEEAIALWRDAFEVSDERRARVAGAERERALYGEKLRHRELARSLAWAQIVEGAPIESFDSIERGRDRVLRDLLARSEADLVAQLSQRDPVAGKRLASLFVGEAEAFRQESFLTKNFEKEGMGLPAGSARRTEMERELADARARLRDAEAALHLELRSIWPEAHPLSCNEVRSALGDGELLVSYVWSPLGVGGIVVPPLGTGEPEGFFAASGEAAVEELRSAVEAEIRRTRSSDGPADARTAMALCDALLPPAIRPRLLDSRRILVVPDGPLNELAFGALMLGEGPLLAAGPEIVLASSASFFVERRRLARERPPSPDPEVLLVGDPRREVVAAPATSGPRSLLGSSQEATEIARIVEGVGGRARLLLGTQASRAAVDEAAPELTHLHFACHGLLGSDEDAYASGLTLADESLDLEHLLRNWRGRLGRAELVVLSACDTQRAVKLGDADVSLPWGFFYAGAPTVVATLWKVDDSAAVLLMTRFYENLLGAHEEERRAGDQCLAPGTRVSVATALREAKLWLRAQAPEANRARLESLGLEAKDLRGEAAPPGPLAPPRLTEPAARWDYSHPRFWAPFVVFGAGD